jgi:hypothetical protein
VGDEKNAKDLPCVAGVANRRACEACIVACESCVRGWEVECRDCRVAYRGGLHYNAYMAHVFRMGLNYI